MVRTDYDNLKTNLKSLTQLIQLARQTVELKAERRRAQEQAPCFPPGGSALDADAAMVRLAAARTQVELLAQQEARSATSYWATRTCRSKNTRPITQAKAALDQAKRDLEHTVLRARFGPRHPGRQHPARPLRDRRHAGVQRHRRPATMGRRQPEGNRHHLSAARPESVDPRRHVPGQHSTARSISVSPGTGAQFAILPPQNASGNWVKVVQRVPVRIRSNAGQNLPSCARA